MVIAKEFPGQLLMGEKVMLHVPHNYYFKLVYQCQEIGSHRTKQFRTKGLSVSTGRAARDND